MSEENESKPAPGQNEEPHTRSAQAQRDEEIEAIQRHSKHQPPGIQKPPDLPPAPPSKALMIVGILLLILLAAGALTLWDHVTHEQALAWFERAPRARVLLNDHVGAETANLPLQVGPFALEPTQIGRGQYVERAVVDEGTSYSLPLLKPRIVVLKILRGFEGRDAVGRRVDQPHRSTEPMGEALVEHVTGFELLPGGQGHA